MEEKQLKKHHVMIKGTKDGLTFIFDDQCTFADLICELEDKLSEGPHNKPDGNEQVTVNLVVGKRYLRESQLATLTPTFAEKLNATIDMVDSDIISKDEAKEIYESKAIQRVEKIVRSGQVIHVESDLLLIGDVNPGGAVKAKGNIYILGKLLGSAHAGCGGNGGAMIYAAHMQPTQLSISDTRWLVPDDDEAASMLMSCAYLNEQGTMEIEEITKLMTLNPAIFQGYNKEKKHN